VIPRDPEGVVIALVIVALSLVLVARRIKPPFA
jgi:hypothetical protein